MQSWILTATVPATVFDVYDVDEVLDTLAEFDPMLDGGTVDGTTGRRRPWQVTIDVPAPTADRAAAAGVRVVEIAFGRRALGFEVMTHDEQQDRISRAVEALRRGGVPADPWAGLPCIP